MTNQKVLVNSMVEPEIKESIDQKRGYETRSSFIRRILVAWHNQQKGAKIIEE